MTGFNHFPFSLEAMPARFKINYPTHSRFSAVKFHVMLIPTIVTILADVGELTLPRLLHASRQIHPFRYGGTCRFHG